MDWKLTGAQQKAQADAAGARLQSRRGRQRSIRPTPTTCFILTDGGEGSTSGGGGGLWRLRFADIDQPELGGALALLMDEDRAIGANKPDNLTIADGNIVIRRIRVVTTSLPASTPTASPTVPWVRSPCSTPTASPREHRPS
ncbi:MAG: hypothetical protein R2699_07800 [Acidimicrobiales bacterium]